MATDLDQLHKDYWERLRQVQAREAPDLKKGREENRYFIYTLGVSGTQITASILAETKIVRFYLLLEGEHRQAWFQKLSEQKDRIEADLGERAIWIPGEKKPNRSWVTVVMPVDDPFDRSDWPPQQEWILDRVHRFYKAFHKRLHDLKGAP